MKKILLIASLLFLGATGARADIVHRISASTQLTVDSAASAATRIGSSYSVQGSNLTAGTMGGSCGWVDGRRNQVRVKEIKMARQNLVER